ncbi:MAG: Ig-like domain-containing protein, partial [Oscillospiraceae bacterium]|nr:Ig-like domain-containing protein [Oscillospiraceae bacterium]
ADNQNIIWSSSNSAVATVSAAGVVTGISAGSATVTATAAADGSKKATASITVTENSGSVPPPSLPAKLTLTLNQVFLGFLEHDTNSIQWYSDKPKVLSVDQATGKLAYHHIPGTAVIEGRQVVDGTESIVYRTEVTVQYSALQWLAAIFLLGFLWL